MKISRSLFTMGAALLVFSWPASAQTDKPPTAVSIAPYDVASIRMYSSMYSPGMHISTGNGRLSAENATLRFLIRTAYDLPDTLLVGGPSWVGEKVFDVTAKTDKVTPIDQAQLSIRQLEAYDTEKMIPLQKLLADRFRLETHHEDRVTPIYALVIAKGGLKIQRSDENSKLGSPDLTGSFPGMPGLKITGRGVIVASNVTLDQLARFLTGGALTRGSVGKDVDRPVLNKTGLSGRYDFTLEWTPGMTPDDTSSAPSLFTALQEQLGLKLEPQKGPVDVTVIDHAELPSEN